MDIQNLLDSLPDHAILLSDGERGLDRAALAQGIARIGAALGARARPQAPVGMLADNSPEWLMVDLATQALGLTLVPLPLFFTAQQWAHVVAESGIGALFCADPGQGAALGFDVAHDTGGPLALCESSRAPRAAPLDGVQKLTFTSGTTSAPKGVCLSAGQQWEVARALCDGVAPLGLERHLCLLPFAVLLENLAGPYTALLSGATTICPPLQETGMRGASGFDAGACLDAIARHAPHSITLVPQMLGALVAASAPGDRRIASLRFVAVGGGKMPPQLIEAARARGFPVFEGYGLSECASVVALNLPGAQRDGSVGRPLAHRRVAIAADGEILVEDCVARYLGQPVAADPWLATGDLGHLDADGFLFVDGRKKDILITGYGRNVSPEWPEAVLLGTGLFAQAMVLGEAQPYLGALLVPARPGLAPAQLQEAVDRANAQLPDYAQVRRWRPVPPFSPAAGLLTPNGRLRRAAIRAAHAHDIASLFDQPEYST
ncbi:AMP-binding protein [Massilia sp. UBA6681]|uniref:AMP-binding protein n=1 Tax=Massilia sp. UBA6681 TaxID=1946839 RepID=UPI0025BF0318|nr:AMP-binding protein [Massilia sp. UBA6681]